MNLAEQFDPAVVLQSQNASLRGIVEKEKDLKLKYLAVDETRWSLGRCAVQDARRDLLQRAADFLELNLALIALWEAAIAIGAKTISDVKRDSERVSRIANGLSGLNVLDVIRRNSGILAAGRSHEGPTPELPHDLSELAPGFLRVASSVLEATPVDELLDWSRQLELPAFGHRCRVAHDRLRALVTRHALVSDPKAATLGRAYSEGRVRVEEVATILGVRVEDAVAWLETMGFCRSIDAIRLSGEDRGALLTEIARKREQQPPGPPDASITRRAAIASQRIEDIDARPWLPPAPE